MKLTIHLQGKTKDSKHRVEFDAPHPDGRGMVKCLIDGEPVQPDCIQIAPGVYSILLGGRSYEARIVSAGRLGPEAANRHVVTIGSRHFTVEIHDPRRRRTAHNAAAQAGPQEIVAPMPGKIVKILAEQDQEVAPGAGLLVIEAMKMQNELRAPRAGRISKIYVREGSGVEAGAKLVRID